MQYDLTLPHEWGVIGPMVRNPLNEEYLVDAFEFLQNFLMELQIWGIPRLYGLEVT